MAIDGIMLRDNTLTTATAISGKDTSQLDMDDFLNLMVAQMTNQDMMNPTSDTEFISQMAQFSALQGVQNILEYQQAAYATSYAGKYVTIADTTLLGELVTVRGKVEAVTFYDGTPKVTVNGETYDLYKVMEVSDTEILGSVSDAASYIGKTVTVRYLNDFREAQTVTGVVTGVKTVDNELMVIIDGEDYPASGISQVHETGTSGSVNDASGYIGKTVTVQYLDDNKESQTVNGVVTGVKTVDNELMVIIDGEDYPASGITQIHETEKKNSQTASGASGKLAANYDTELAAEMTRRLANGSSNNPSDYSYEEILAYAHSITSNKTGSSVRSAEEIAQMIIDQGYMRTKDE